VSDTQSRLLQRDAASGDLDASCKLLRNKIRSGQLSFERVYYAAALGHPAAQQIASGPIDVRTHWTIVGGGLDLLDHLNIVRYTCRVMRQAIDDDTYLQKELESILEWVDCPCDKHKLPWLTHLYERYPRPTIKVLAMMQAVDVPNFEVSHRMSFHVDAAVRAVILAEQAGVSFDLIIKWLCESLLEEV